MKVYENPLLLNNDKENVNQAFELLRHTNPFKQNLDHLLGGISTL